MPGFLSTMFDDAAPESNHQTDQTEHAAAADGMDIAVDPSVHTEMAASYETPAGTTHSYADSEDVSVTLSAHAAFTTTTDATQDVGSTDF